MDITYKCYVNYCCCRFTVSLASCTLRDMFPWVVYLNMICTRPRKQKVANLFSFYFQTYKRMGFFPPRMKFFIGILNKDKITIIIYFASICTYGLKLILNIFRIVLYTILCFTMRFSKSTFLECSNIEQKSTTFPISFVKLSYKHRKEYFCQC